MHQLKRIIVGHDLRTSGETAFRSAIILAEKSEATLRLVHVVEPYVFYQRLSHPFTASYSLEDLVQKAGEKLAALTTSTELAPLRVEYEVRTGKPFVELISARRAWHADLIVVGGTARDEARLLGSTSARVVRKAGVPVLVTQTALTAAAKTFLVPTDFSECARRTAEEALALAERFGGRVYFFHALELPYFSASPYGADVPPPDSPPLTPADLEGEWDVFLAALPSLENVPWDKRTVEGHTATAIVREATENQADIIVMGTHGRTGLAHMLVGSVAEEVARTAPCSVLTIPPKAFRFELP